MRLELTDLTEDFLAFWSRASGLDDAAWAAAWQAEYAAAHPTVFATYARHWRPEDVAPARQRLARLLPRLPGRATRVRERLARLVPALDRLFAPPDAPLRWVLVVGLGTSDGWLDWVDGQPACFCATEALDGDPAVHLAHESAHACHALVQPSGLQDMENIGHALFGEGLAVNASALLVPGLTHGDYLWGGNIAACVAVTGMMPAEWVAACEAAWPRLREALLADLPAADSDRSATYFLGRRPPTDLPLRCGYFAGYRLVRRLLDRAPLAELARWPAERALREIGETLRATAPPPG